MDYCESIHSNMNDFSGHPCVISSIIKAKGGNCNRKVLETGKAIRIRQMAHFLYFFEGEIESGFSSIQNSLYRQFVRKMCLKSKKKSKKYEMKIKSDPLLHLKTKCGKVNLSCFCILQKKNFYRAGSAQDNPFF